VHHFDLYKLPKSKVTNANILCLVQFRLEQISAVTDSVMEQQWPDHTITNSKHIFYISESVSLLQ